MRQIIVITLWAPVIVITLWVPVKYLFPMCHDEQSLSLCLRSFSPQIPQYAVLRRSLPFYLSEE